MSIYYYPLENKSSVTYSQQYTGDIVLLVSTVSNG